MALLANLRVLDFSRYIAGPYCASILADLGAEVIRIEPVGGGEDRLLVPVTPEGEGAIYIQLNRNKKSLAIDMASEPGRVAIERLVASADIAITNMPVTALRRYGLDYETLRAIKADLIVTNLSAFGATGPLAAKTGFDAVAQSMSGAAFLGGSRRRPSRAASSYVDYGTGLAAALGTLAAIIHRTATGEGQNVQASLLATAMTFINAAHIEAAATGRDREPFGNRSPFSGPSDLLPTRDGSIAVQVVGNAMFRRWAKLVERADLAKDRRFRSDSERGRNGRHLSRIMRAWTAQRTTAEAIEQLEKAGIPCGPILTPQEALCDAQVAGSEILEDASESLPAAKLLVQLSAVPTGSQRPAPRVGENSLEVLRSVGYADAEIMDFVKFGYVGVFSGPPGGTALRAWC